MVYVVYAIIETASIRICDYFIKSKILAAKRSGIHTIIISQENRKDIEDIKEIYVAGLDFIYVNNIQDVIDFIF